MSVSQEKLSKVYIKIADLGKLWLCATQELK